MKALALVIVAGACYSPNPIGDISADGVDASSSVDGSDAEPPTPVDCAIPGTWPDTTNLTTLDSMKAFAAYTTDMGRTIATYDRRVTGEVTPFEVQSALPDSELTTRLIANDDNDPWHTPFLAPEGDEVFLMRTAGSLKIPFVMRKTAGTWRSPVALSILDANNQALGFASDSDHLGTPTALSIGPRRMMIESGNAFFEIREESPTTWRIVERYIAADLQLTSMEDPQLSPDGLRLVFIGSAGSGTSIRGITRTSFTRFASTAQVIVASPQGVIAHPFLSHACEYLYFFDDTAIARYMQ